MRHFIFISFLILSVNPTFGQKKADFFIDEFCFSANRTNCKDDNTSNKNGFGIGAYHSFLSDKRINLMFGTEFNRTSQFKKSMYEGHFANATDLTYVANCISIPFGLRIYIGKATKFFIESGGYADLVIRSSRKGTMHFYLPDSSSQLNNTEYQINQKAGLPSVVGIYSGIGLRIPVSNYELVVKSDYKFGFKKQNSNTYMDVIYDRYFRIIIGLKIK